MDYDRFWVVRFMDYDRIEGTKVLTRNVHALWSDSLRVCVNHVQMIHVWNQL